MNIDLIKRKLVRVLTYCVFLGLPVLLSLLIMYGVFNSFYCGYMSYKTGVEYCLTQGLSQEYCEYNWDKVQIRK